MAAIVVREHLSQQWNDSHISGELVMILDSELFNQLPFLIE